MSILSAIIQGIVQGLTEFLPVSSSGHLALYQYFTGINSESSATFSIMLHLGTLIAVIIAFRKTIWELLKEFFGIFVDLFHGRLLRVRVTPHRKMLYLLMLSCVPLFLVLPLQNWIKGISADNDILIEGICFLITSMLLTLADRAPRGMKKAGTMGVKDSIWIGLAQCVATMPGISRSGSTIAAGQLRGLDRGYAVTYSFILGLPTVLAAVVLDLKDVSAGSSDIGAGAAIIGMLTAAVFGLLAIRLVKYLIKSDKFRVFAIYTLIIGSLTVILGIIEKFTGNAIQAFVTGLIH